MNGFTDADVLIERLSQRYTNQYITTFQRLNEENNHQIEYILNQNVNYTIEEFIEDMFDEFVQIIMRGVLNGLTFLYNNNHPRLLYNDAQSEWYNEFERIIIQKTCSELWNNFVNDIYTPLYPATDFIPQEVFEHLWPFMNRIFYLELKEHLRLNNARIQFDPFIIQFLLKQFENNIKYTFITIMRMDL